MEDDMNGKVILGVCAHMDDLEWSCAGTVAKWVKQGATAFYLILTDGSKGLEDRQFSAEELTKIRREEQKEAAKITGVKEVFFCDFEDGYLEVDHLVRKEIVKVIRQVKPDIVITMDPTFLYDEEYGFINHPDHRAAGQNTLDAVFPFARNNRTYPDLYDEGFPAHIVKEVLLRNFRKSNFFVDVTETIDIKVKALAAHKSQGNDADHMLHLMKERAKAAGVDAHYDYAEGFIRIKISS